MLWQCSCVIDLPFSMIDSIRDEIDSPCSKPCRANEEHSPAADYVGHPTEKQQ
jgi:hypothetical protein